MNPYAISYLNASSIAWTYFQHQKANPAIEARITGYNDSGGNFSAMSTTNFNASITVAENLLLVLVCIAPYPVYWRSSKGVEKTMKEKNVEFFPVVDNESFAIPAALQYSAVLELSGRDLVPGYYLCLGEHVESPDTVTKIEVKLPEPNTGEKSPLIVSTGFSDSSVRYGSDLRHFIAWFRGTSSNVYLTLRNGKKIAPSEEIVDGVQLQISPVSSNVNEANLLIKENYVYESFGYYTFQIELTTGDEIYNFQLLDTAYYTTKRCPVPGIGETVLPVHMESFYEIQCRYFDGSPLLRADVEISAPSGNSNCTSTPLTLEEATGDCGVLGVTTVYDDITLEVIGTSVLLFPARSCTVSCRMVAKDAPLQQESDYAYLMVFDAGISSYHIGYDYLTDSRSSYQYPQARFPVIRLVGVPHRKDNVILTNENFTLRCFAPACGWKKITWCRSRNGECYGQSIAMAGDLWSVDATSPTGSASESCFRQYLFYKYNNFLVALDMIIPHASTRDDSEFSCVLYWPNRRDHTQFFEYMYNDQDENSSEASYIVNVEDPRRPTFDDGKVNFTENLSLDPNGNLTLQCSVDGVPEPDVNWLKYVNDEITEPVDSSTTTATVHEAGVYECQAKNEIGEAYRKFTVRGPEMASDRTTVIAVTMTGFIVLTILVAALVLWEMYRRRKATFKEIAFMLGKPIEDVSLNSSLPLHDQVDVLPYSQNYEVDRDRFTLSTLLGGGISGKVFKGVFAMKDNRKVQVAVKVPSNPSNVQNFRDLVADLKIMAFIPPHVNVISLIGAHTSAIEKKRQLFVLMEFCEHGSLKAYLETHWSVLLSFALNTDGSRKESSSTLDLLLSFAYQAANGMAYLATKNIIHRDLALRNLLLTSWNIVKISDFGMSRRQPYAYQKHASPEIPLPIWWMAPESLADGRYTQKSDVWSFGVLLWEIFTGGVAPYCGLGLDDIPSMVSWLKAESGSQRLTKPQLAPSEIYDLMLQCWKCNPKERPTFGDCRRYIDQHLETKTPNGYAALQERLSNAWRSVALLRQSINGQVGQVAQQSDSSQLIPDQAAAAESANADLEDQSQLGSWMNPEDGAWNHNDLKCVDAIGLEPCDYVKPNVEAAEDISAPNAV